MIITTFIGLFITIRAAKDSQMIVSNIKEKKWSTVFTGTKLSSNNRNDKFLSYRTSQLCKPNQDNWY